MNRAPEDERLVLNYSIVAILALLAGIVIGSLYARSTAFHPSGGPALPHPREMATHS